MLAQLFRSRPTRFDLPLAIFLATAVLALLIAYDWLSALTKFAMLVFSVWLYYAITGGPRQALRDFPRYSSWLGALIAIYFLFTNSWQMAPANFAPLQKAARIWMAVTPQLPLPGIHPNQAGGLLAMLLPFASLHIHHMRKKRQSSSLSTHHYLFAWMVGLIFIGGLLMTGSRGAWLSLFLAAILCLSWLGLGYFSRRISAFALAGLVVLCLLVLMLAGGWLLGDSAILHSLLDRFQNSTTINSRLDLYRDTLTLIADFPYTGSGLNTFPGLYSRYILSIPVVFFYYGHNLYLDLLLEQGPLALLAVLAIYLSTTYRLIKTTKLTLGSAQLYPEHRNETQPQSSRGLAQISGFLPLALLASLLTLLLHGLIDDPLYGTLGAPFLFLLPAMTIALDRFPNGDPAKAVSSRNTASQSRLLQRGLLPLLAWAALGLLFLIALIPTWRNTASANWYTNIGNISFARYELISFPTGRWDEHSDVYRMARAQRWFDQALKFAPDHPAAHYRLGLIASRLYDFPAAVYHFETAYQAGLDHKGVLKNLAYSYVWSGHLATAMPLLVHIPEARSEMNAYTGWWRRLVQKELSERAQQTVLALENHARPSD